jgi:hypothetical protein
MQSFSNPEKQRILSLGSSKPSISQVPFSEAVHALVNFAIQGDPIFTDFETDGFIAPNPTYFQLKLIRSDAFIKGVSLTREGYSIQVSDADYVSYEGKARMRAPLGNIILDRNQRFMLLQSYLDRGAYQEELIRIQESTPGPILVKLLNPERNRAS